MRAFLIILAIIIVIGGVIAGFMYLNKSDSSQQTATHNQNSLPDNSSAIEQTEDVQTGEVAVTIRNRAYSPKTLTVTKGTTVTWTNEDAIQHNVVSDIDSQRKGLNGPLLNKGQSYSFTFDTVGVYTYHCTPHPDMTGRIEVVE